jgi:hypothetical protein
MKKRLFRPSVFETNSSSAHSLSIADNTKEFVFDSLTPDEDGVIKLYSDEFGWGWFKHNDAYTKAVYVIQSLGLTYLVEDVILKQTGAERVEFHDNDGYIDHQSTDLLSDISDDAEAIRNFIFNKNSWLFGGNDNSTAAPEFYHVPEYKDGKMIQPRYKYRLVFNKLNLETKLLDKLVSVNDETIDIIRGLLEYVDFDKDGNKVDFYHSRSKGIQTFRFSYKSKINLEESYVELIDNGIWDKTHDIMKERFGEEEREDKFKLRGEIERELLSLPNSPYIYKLYFEQLELN